MLDKMENERALGYILISVGLPLIFISIFLMIIVFIGVSSPPILVHFPNVTMQAPYPIENENQTSSYELTEMFFISGEALSKTVAIFFWFLFMLFILVAGGRLTALGISLLKETKAEEEEPQTSQTYDTSNGKASSIDHVERLEL